MPHSSGGGGSSSSSGGSSSHSSSSHSSSRSGRPSGHSSSTRVSKTYFPGAYQYVKYDDTGTPRYIYSSSRYLNRPSTTKQERRASVFLRLVLLFPFIMCGILLAKGSFAVPQRLNHTTLTNDVIVEDSLKIMSQDEIRDLEKELKNFLNLTGIPVCVVTREDETWSEKYQYLEKYAYELYFKKFDDEDHWLLIYSQTSDPERPNQKSTVWRFEGMQGDNTDKILTRQKTARFNHDLQTILQGADTSVGYGFITAFQNLSADVMKLSFNREIFFMAVAWNLFISVFIFFVLVFPVLLDRKYADYELCKDENDIARQQQKQLQEQMLADTERWDPLGLPIFEQRALVPCSSCGRYYYPNQHECCPFCLAPSSLDNATGGRDESEMDWYEEQEE